MARYPVPTPLLALGMGAACNFANDSPVCRIFFQPLGPKGIFDRTECAVMGQESIYLVRVTSPNISFFRSPSICTGAKQGASAALLEDMNVRATCTRLPPKTSAAHFVVFGNVMQNARFAPDRLYLSVNISPSRPAVVLCAGPNFSNPAVFSWPTPVFEH